LPRRADSRQVFTDKPSPAGCGHDWDSCQFSHIEIGCLNVRARQIGKVAERSLPKRRRAAMRRNHQFDPPPSTAASRV